MIREAWNVARLLHKTILWINRRILLFSKRVALCPWINAESDVVSLRRIHVWLTKPDTILSSLHPNFCLNLGIFGEHVRWILNGGCCDEMKYVSFCVHFSKKLLLSGSPFLESSCWPSCLTVVWTQTCFWRIANHPSEQKQPINYALIAN